MDLTSQVIDAINGWLAAAVAQVLSPVVAVLGHLLFTTPAFDDIAEVTQTWSLVRGVADALFGLALLAAGVAVMARGGSDARYSAKDGVDKAPFVRARTSGTRSSDLRAGGRRAVTCAGRDREAARHSSRTGAKRESL